MSDSCVAIRFKILTYFVYAPLLNRIDALLSNIIYDFESNFFASNTRKLIQLLR
jgi:hypothetical protein